MNRIVGRALSEKQVFMRARRLTRKHGILLRRTRPESTRSRDLGRFYAVNSETGFIEASRVRLEDVALELGIMGPADTIVSE
jgi:hypothetical protein